MEDNIEKKIINREWRASLLTRNKYDMFEWIEEVTGRKISQEERNLSHKLFGKLYRKYKNAKGEFDKGRKEGLS